MMKKFLLPLLLILAPMVLTAAGKPYDRVIVSVNNFAITEQQVKVKLMTEAAANGLSPDSPKIRDLYYKKVLQGLEEEALIESRGVQLGVTIPESMIEEELENFLKQRRLTRIGFEMLLEEQGQNITEYKAGLRKKLIRDRVLIMEVQTQVILSDRKLKAIFMESGAKTIKAHARHILILVDKTASTAEVGKARAKLMSIRAKIQKGASFNKMADKHSEDPSAKTNHGDLGFFASGQMVAPFSKAAFSLPLNKISKPVRTSYGFHIIQVLERKEFDGGAYEAVKRQFQQQETQKLYKTKYKEFITKVRAKAHIQYHEWKSSFFLPF